jgi:NADH-quinone oxidoreductase subunit G
MLCPAQCNTELTVRDERVLRVLDRHHEGVDDGWLCDKGRFAYQAIHVDDRLTTPLVRDGDGDGGRGGRGELRPAGWDEALARAAELLAGAGDRTAALAGSTATNEEGMLLARMLRGALGSPHLDSRSGPPVDLDHLRALNAPALQASVPDLEFAHAVLVLDCEPVDDAPILEMRIRKGVRRNRVKLAVATSRPSALDPSAAATARFAPGHAAAFLAALAGALSGPDADLDSLATAAGCTPSDLAAVAAALEGAEDVVVLYSERILGAAHPESDAGTGAAAGLLALAGQLGLARAPGAGLIGIPEAANGRGLREAGVLPNAGPGLTAPPAPGRGAPAIAEGLAGGELEVVYLLGSDPLRNHPGRRAWEAGLGAAAGVIAHAAFLTEGIRDHADVVFPAEATAEKEGTVTHPDGRVQRLRPAIGRPGDVRPEWQVLHELSGRLGSDPGLPTIALCSEALFAAVPFYAGLTLTELGGRGIRWPVRPGAGELLPGGPDTATAGEAGGGAEAGGAQPPPAPAPRRSNALTAPGARLLLGTYRSIWAAPEVEYAPALKFLAREQRVELSPADAARLGIRQGDEVLVTGGADQQVRGRAELRNAIPEGRVFLEAGIAEHAANGIDGPLVSLHRATSTNGGPSGSETPARARA